MQGLVKSYPKHLIAMCLWYYMYITQAESVEYEKHIIKKYFNSRGASLSETMKRD